MEHSKAETFSLDAPSISLSRDWFSTFGSPDTYSLSFRESKSRFELNVKGLTLEQLANIFRNEDILEQLSQQERKESRSLEIVRDSVDSQPPQKQD